MLGVTVQVYVTLRARTRIRVCARTYIRNYDRRRVLRALSFYGDERQQRAVAKRFLSYARTIVGTVRNVNLLLTATVHHLLDVSVKLDSVLNQGNVLFSVMKFFTLDMLSLPRVSALILPK